MDTFIDVCFGSCKLYFVNELLHSFSIDLLINLFLHLRYALDVNVESAEDVLTHKRLLHLAHDPANRPAFDVRLVQVSSFLKEGWNLGFNAVSYEWPLKYSFS